MSDLQASIDAISKALDERNELRLKAQVATDQLSKLTAKLDAALGDVGGDTVTKLDRLISQLDKVRNTAKELAQRLGAQRVRARKVWGQSSPAWRTGSRERARGCVMAEWDEAMGNAAARAERDIALQRAEAAERQRDAMLAECERQMNYRTGAMPNVGYWAAKAIRDAAKAAAPRTPTEDE